MSRECGSGETIRSTAKPAARYAADPVFKQVEKVRLVMVEARGVAA
jgi:hypothetical protein